MSQELSGQVELRVKRMVLQRWMAANRRGVQRAFYIMKCHVQERDMIENEERLKQSLDGKLQDISQYDLQIKEIQRQID